MATPRVLDVLGERGVKATFFVVGEQLREHRELAERAAAEGHWIGNHTFTHPRPRSKQKAAAKPSGNGVPATEPATVA